VYLDGCQGGIVVDKKAQGHRISGTIQMYNVAERTALHFKYHNNSWRGMVWDASIDSVAKIYPGVYNCFIDFQTENTRKYVKNYGHPANNIIGINNLFGYNATIGKIQFYNPGNKDLVFGDNKALTNTKTADKYLFDNDVYLQGVLRMKNNKIDVSDLGFRFYSAGKSSVIARFYYGNTEIFKLAAKGFYPSAANVVSLGLPNAKWAKFYTKNIADDGTNVTIDDILILSPRSYAPSNPKPGTVYVNSTTNHVYIYLNNKWKQLDN
jgi:hypothetical protein